jgi:acyl-CoA reductase-like NAD-dependent aldehyde dehydrogenase
MSTERIIVQDSIAIPFKTVLLEELEARREEATLVTVKAAEKVEGLIEDAKSKGAEVKSANNGKIREGATMSPSIIFNVTPAMRLYTEESFGPCTSVITVASAEEAVKVANESAYGLSAAVFCGDTAKAIAVAKKIQSGAVHINSGTFHDEHTLPHGGTKQSGWGRFGSTWGLREFLQTKTVMIHDVHV